MNNKYITDTILAQQANGGSVRLSDVDYKEITDREHHVMVSIADRQRQLEAIIKMQQWYKQNEQATALLEDTTNHHNQVNKQYLALRNEEMRLELFDSVQDLHHFYEKIEERRRVIEGIKQMESGVAQAIEQMRVKISDAEKQHTIAKDRLNNAEEQLHQRQGIIDHGYALDGEMKILVSQLMTAEDALADAQQQLGDKETDYKSRQSEIAVVKQQLETLNLRNQALSVHQQLFEQYYAVTDKLQLYNSEVRTNERMHQHFADNNTRHVELQTQHDKTKRALQAKRDRLDALRADQKVHETAIDEIDSAVLYRHFSLYKERLIQLQSARTAWSNIVGGYENIESHNAAIERMQRQLDQKRMEQQIAEREVNRLFEQFNRLSKSYILLQIEHTRKLRDSLREGNPCPVCGSAHHPYNTEVEQELGETQTQLEKDYVSTKRDYEDKQSYAAEVRAEALKHAGQLEAEREVLERMMENQRMLEADWVRFSRLDQSFATCSASVNREARRTTIEMLIDSTNRHIREYEQKINRYDFHATQLHNINAEVRQTKAEVDELQQQFWQLDTELQVNHERVETFRTLMYESDNRLEHLYEDLDVTVTLNGWRDDNTEAFSKNLAELYKEWTHTNSELEKCQHEFNLLSFRSGTAEAACKQLRYMVGQNREERDRLREQLNSKRERLRKDFGASNPTELAASLIMAIEEARRNCNEAKDTYENCKHELANLIGQQNTIRRIRELQEEKLRENSNMFDHAIARYNLTHQTIQVAELANVFNDTRDWQLLRQTITECRDALLVAAEQMGAAERHVIELHNMPGRPSQDNPADRPEALVQRHADIVLELEALRGEQADIRRILKRHHETANDFFVEEDY